MPAKKNLRLNVIKECRWQEKQAPLAPECYQTFTDARSAVISYYRIQTQDIHN